MPRKPRLHIAGGFYHVIARGNSRQNVFNEPSDFLHWQKLLSLGIDRYGHRLHAYCWMTNHVHIAIQAGRDPLSRFMGSVVSRYAKSFNRKYGRSGHLFERRYRAIVVQEDNYLLELVRYIHLNPLRAKIVDDLLSYPWSSHITYAGGACPDWLTTDTILSQFGRSLRQSRNHYLEFIGAGQSSSMAQLFRRGTDENDQVLGAAEWIKKVQNESQPRAQINSLDDLILNICRQNNVTEIDLASPSRARHLVRIRAHVALAATECGVSTVTEIARRFGRSQPALSRSMSRLRRR